MPTTDTRIQIADLLLARTPDLFNIMKVFFDAPSVRNDLQNRFGGHLQVAAGISRPITSSMLQQNHADRATKDFTGRDERLVASLLHHASTSVRDRLPTVSPTGASLQADAVLAIFARPSTLPRLTRRNIEQFCIAAKPGYHNCALSKKRADQRTGGISSVKDNDKSGERTKSLKHYNHPLAKLQREFVFGAKLPAIASFDRFYVDLANIQLRQQRQSDDAEQGMRKQYRQANPVMTVKPIAVARPGCRVVMNVGRLDMPPVALSWGIIDGQRPIAVWAWIKSLADDAQQRMH